MEPDFNPNVETAATEQPDEEPTIFAAAYNRYQRTVELVTDRISRGYLVKAGESLLGVSRWLSENMDALSEVTLELWQARG